MNSVSAEFSAGLVWFLYCGSARFRIIDESGEARVAVERAEVRISIQAQIALGRQSMVNGVVQQR